MNKFSIDYVDLEEKTGKKRVFKLEDVKDRIQKVAFDVVRFVDADDNLSGLWRVEHTFSGDYIVAMYDEEGPREKTASAPSNWEVYADNTNRFLTFFYKNEHVAKIAAEKLGLSSYNLGDEAKYLPKKLASNENLVKGLMQEVPFKTRFALFDKYPELTGTK